MAVAVAPVLAAHRRMLAPDRSAYEQFDRIYTPLLVVAIVVAVLWRVVHEAILALTPSVSATWLPAGGLLLVLGLARFGVWQGPVSFTAADCAFLLGAPLRRATLVRRRLRSGALVAAVGGLLLGGVVAAGAAKTEPGDVVGLTIANGALLTLLGAALSWHVQRSARITTIVVRLTPVALVAAVLLVVGAHHGLRDDLVWSGPWGWAEVALTTTSTAAHVLATALILLLAAIAWVLAWRTAGSCPRERFEARASTRATLSAAAFTADYRSMLTARRSTGTPGRAARIAFGGSQRTIVIWRDVRYLAGTPLRAVSAFGLAFAGGLVAVTNADRAGLVLLGTALLATAGVGLLEPLRIEVDHPDRARILLPWTYGQGLWRHCEAPIAIVSLGVVTSALAAGVAGSAPWGAAGLGVVIGLPAAAVVVLCGAISGRRGGRLPTEKMIGTTGDPTGFSGIGMIGLWLSFWPVFGTIAAAVPALVANASDSPGGPALTGAAINISVAVGLRAYLITKD